MPELLASYPRWLQLLLMAMAIIAIGEVASWIIARLLLRWQARAGEAEDGLPPSPED